MSIPRNRSSISDVYATIKANCAKFGLTILEDPDLEALSKLPFWQVREVQLKVRCIQGHETIKYWNHLRWPKLAQTHCVICAKLKRINPRKFRNVIKYNLRTLPFNPQISAGEACKMLQCNPTVTWFNTTIVPTLEKIQSIYRNYTIQIIEQIRKIEKKLFQCHKVRKKEVVVAAAIILTHYHIFKENSFNVSKIETLCHCTGVSIRTLLRIVLGQDDYETLFRYRLKHPHPSSEIV